MVYDLGHSVGVYKKKVAFIVNETAIQCPSSTALGLIRDVCMLILARSPSPARGSSKPLSSCLNLFSVGESTRE